MFPEADHEADQGLDEGYRGDGLEEFGGPGQRQRQMASVSTDQKGSKDPTWHPPDGT